LWYVSAYDAIAGTYSLLTPTTDFTVVVATKTFTFDAAAIPAAADHIVIRYKHL
jgi:hypothetical protein